MKIIRVTYTTTPEYSSTNQVNIKTVMQDLQNLNNPGIFYSVLLESDQKTFIHTAFFKVEGEQHLLIDLPSFKHFQGELIRSKPEVPPKQELLSLVGTSNPMFNF